MDDNCIVGDLISRKALIERLAYYHAHSYGKAEYAYGVAVEEVVKAPTIDAVPVVHAKWRQARFTQAPLYICSECDNQAYTSHHYCPNCGAKMDGGIENERE